MELSDFYLLDLGLPLLRGKGRLDIHLEESVDDLDEHENNAVDLMAFLDEP